MALRHLPFNTLMEIKIDALENIVMSGASVLEAPDALKNVENYYNEIDRPHTLIRLLRSTAKSPTNKLQIVATTTFLFDESLHEEPKIVHEMWDNNMHLMKFSKSIEKNKSYSFSIIAASISSAHHPDPLNEAERLVIFGKLEGKQRLLNRHHEAWNNLWQSRIEIDGDDSVQQQINSMIYHLYAFNREGSKLSSSPMGLSGLGYNGHVFWDTELWMYPALLLLQPNIAKNMIEYRFNRLEAAKQNTFSKGFKGAMFPWESAESGVEETPVWALSGPFEHHISACVAIAAWNYFCVTQDTTWLKEKGWQILEATAEFWTSRVGKDSQGKHHINNVVAADEWAENVNDNAFTNAAAKKNLEYAIKAAKILKQTYKPIWETIANTLVFEKMPDGSTKEHATYKGETIKQADVNLLAYPLGVITNKEQIEKDLTFYTQRVPHVGTPSMTQATFATLYARLQQPTKAYYWLKDAYEHNLNQPFSVIAETKGGTNPYFATAAGGIIQSLLMGFGGLEITTQGILQNAPSLPTKWKKMTLVGIGKDKKNYEIK